MRMTRLLPSSIALAGLLVLSGCESVDEKAERLYERSVALAAEDDAARAIVTLRSVFNLNSEHRDARMLYASLSAEQGDYEEAFAHYRIVAEQYPLDFDARLELARLAVRFGAWAEAETQVDAALKIRTDDPAINAISNVLAYRKAVERNNDAGIDEAVAAARDALVRDPEDTYSRQVVVDHLIREESFTTAIEELDKALAVEPLSPEFNQLKLAIYAQLEDMDALGEQLKLMVERFPENVEVRSALVRWYMANNDPDGAEQFVRELVARSGEDVAPRVALVQFLARVRGHDAALAELETLIAEGLDDVTFTTMRAGLVYDNVDRDEGVAILETLLDGREPSEETRDIQATLARMLVGIGQTQRAQDIVETVLEQDNKNVEALKLKANWLIDEDQTRDAILALRTALDQDPRNVEAITLLARAYERDGNRELMAESLALAVEASGNAPAEALRYANYLIGTEKFLSAEDILVRSLRVDPANVALLNALGQVYVALDDWPRADQVVQALNRIDTVEARTIATGLQATILQSLERTDESITLLRGLMEQNESSLAAQAAIIRTHLSNGEIRPARVFMNELLAEMEGREPTPETDGVRFLNAALLAVEGDFAAAESIYRELSERNPQEEAIWRAYAAILIRQDRDADAEAVIDQGIAALPENGNLLWVKASLREGEGDIDAAIGIYERLYELNSGSTIVANNLASLITTYREDSESLERAYRIARRLRGIEVPAMQDTYGWIAYRMGNYQEALEHLEPAAAGLPDDPSVQYHLAKALVAVGRTDEAVPRLERAVSAWQERGNPRLEDAQAELQRLTTPGSAPAEGN